MFELNRKELTHGWSNAQYAYSYILHPENSQELKMVFQLAEQRKLSVCPVGSARSYGDEIINEDNIVVDCTRMNKVLSWNPITGIMCVEPGVTLQQILKICLKDNWILSVVPGTRYASAGGCASNNVNGKNSFKDGNFGEWVLEFDIILSSLEIITCSREKHADLFFAGIGCLGLFGFVTKLTLQLKKVQSPYLYVKKWTVPNLGTMIEDFIVHASESEYIVGQVDCFTRGESLGRGTIHAAKFTENDSLPSDEKIKGIEVLEKFFPPLPNDLLINLGKMFLNSTTMSWVTTLKYYVDSLSNPNQEFRQSFPIYQFYVDRIPYWPEMYRHGFYEIEPLIPAEYAEQAYTEIIQLSHQYEMPPYVGGIKYHKSDDFILSFGLNGFSIGFDFPALPQRAKEQAEMFYRIHEITIQNEGIVYLAKDNVMGSEHFKLMYGEQIEQILSIKRKYDPQMVLQSNLFRRLFIDNSSSSHQK